MEAHGRLNPITFTTVRLPAAGVGNAPSAQLPTSDPPLINTFGGREPPAFNWTAAPPPGVDTVRFVNWYPAELEAVTKMPFCTPSRSTSLPVPKPQRGFCVVSGESVRRMPA